MFEGSCSGVVQASASVGADGVGRVTANAMTRAAAAANGVPNQITGASGLSREALLFVAVQFRLQVAPRFVGVGHGDRSQVGVVGVERGRQVGAELRAGQAGRDMVREGSELVFGQRAETGLKRGQG